MLKNSKLFSNYFFQKKPVKEGWQDLVSNWENIKEIEIEFEEKEANFKTYKKVVSLWTPGEIIV